jgi:hypothetical protein
MDRHNIVELTRASQRPPKDLLFDKCYARYSQLPPILPIGLDSKSMYLSATYRKIIQYIGKLELFDTMRSSLMEAKRSIKVAHA